MNSGEPLAWVIGRGGLLGSHLESALARGTTPAWGWHSPVPKFTWREPAVLAEQFATAVEAFAHEVRKRRQRWIICWTAGAGVVGSSESELQSETNAWRAFLRLVSERLTAEALELPGSVFFASSAGGVYGDNPQQPLTEESCPNPISAYGRTKLQQEEILSDWIQSQRNISCLIGRISNLYGAGQNLAKPQGLLSHISRCLIYNKPLHLYVPLDMIRDYLPVEACAEHIVTCLDHLTSYPLSGNAGGECVKIFASEQETSLAHIIATFARVSHRRPKMICSWNPAAALQPNRLQFRSKLWRHLRNHSSYSLQTGINRLHQHNLSLYCQGLLTPPS